MVAYSDISYASGVAEMLKLARLRPDLASLSTTQALYNLPTVGTCSNADGSRSACQNYVLEIMFFICARKNRMVLGRTSASSISRCTRLRSSRLLTQLDGTT